MNKDKLIAEARSAQQKARAQYSNYPVGAALLTKSGAVIHGCNIESKAYPTTMCAERVAIYSAIAQNKSDFVEMALVTEDGATPCGSCRQVIMEYCEDIPIHIADKDGFLKTVTSSELLPHPFH